MSVPRSLLDACLRLAADVSPEVVNSVIEALERGDAESAGNRLSGDAAHAFNEICLAWSRDASGTPPGDLALILTGALHAVLTERATKRVELVWSGPSALSSTVRSTEPALLELLNSARSSVYLVTFAAYKVPAIAAAIHAALTRGVRVVFVLESEESSAGKVSFDPLPYLRGDGSLPIEVYVWPLAMRERDERGRHGTLHAKFAVADSERLLVSSANLTEHAFELNIELGVLLTGGKAPEEATSHIDALIRLGILHRQSI